MMALMPVTCWKIARPSPIMSGRRQSRRKTSLQVPPARFVAQRRRNLIKIRFYGVANGGDLFHFARRVLAAMHLHQPAWRFWRDQRDEEKEQTRYGGRASIIRQLALADNRPSTRYARKMPIAMAS